MNILPKKRWFIHVKHTAFSKVRVWCWLGFVLKPRTGLTVGPFADARIDEALEHCRSVYRSRYGRT